MSDFDDSLFPQEPEIEYAGGREELREGYYGTGSTTPPKDHVGVIALVLALIISMSGLISILGLMNIRFPEPTAPTELRSPVSFSVTGDGVLQAELEPRDPVATEPPRQETVDTKIHITAAPQSLENIVQVPGAISWQEVYEKVMP